MSNCEVSLTLLAGMGTALVIAGLSLIVTNLLWMKTLKSLNLNQNQLVENLQQQNQDLLNRLMSQDLQTYATMTALKHSTSSAEQSPYYSQHDEAVVARLKNFSSNQGLGEEVYYPDEDMVGLLEDFGVVNPNIEKE